MARPSNVDYGKIIIFQHEALEAAVDAYQKRINPQLKLDILHDIQKWHERFQTEALLTEPDNAFDQQKLRDHAAELVSLICIYVSEFVE